MKDLFIRLFSYDAHTNLQLAKMIATAGNPERPVQLLAHLLAAQQVWLARCKGENFIGGIWPDWKADSFVRTIEDNSKGWLDYLGTLRPADFDKSVSYRNLSGEGFENKLGDILAHTVNHGTHHRAQAGQYLKLSGTELPFTDFIVYLRQLEQNK